MRASPLARADEAAEQGGRSAPGGDVVDADEVLAPRGRHVGDQRDDDGAARDQVVDRGAHLRMVERHHDDSVEPALQIPQVLRQHERREHIDRLHDGAGALFGQPVRDALHLLVSSVMKLLVPEGSTKASRTRACAPAARRPGQVGSRAGGRPR